ARPPRRPEARARGRGGADLPRARTRRVVRAQGRSVGSERRARDAPAAHDCAVAPAAANADVRAPPLRRNLRAACSGLAPPVGARLGGGAAARAVGESPRVGRARRCARRRSRAAAIAPASVTRPRPRVRGAADAGRDAVRARSGGVLPLDALWLAVTE